MITVVIAGINGSGKTNLLKYIYDYFNKQIYYNNDLTNSIEFLFEKDESRVKEETNWEFINYLRSYEYYKKNNPENFNYQILKNNLKIFPKIIYIFQQKLIFKIFKHKLIC